VQPRSPLAEGGPEFQTIIDEVSADMTVQLTWLRKKEKTGELVAIPELLKQRVGDTLQVLVLDFGLFDQIGSIRFQRRIGDRHAQAG
jgi:hypothetical protein